MLLRSRNVAYLFDLDGTVLNTSKFKNIIQYQLELFKSDVLIQPFRYDIPWSILTSRPLMDYPFIKLACFLKDLYPQKIITSPTLKWKFNNVDEICEFKRKKIIEFSEGKIDGFEKNKIFYIDNDIDIISRMNKLRYDFGFIAIGVNQLVHENIDNFI